MHGAFFSALQPARCLSLFGLKNLRRPGTGIAYIVLTAGCFATTDATVKHLGAALPVLVLLWSRYVFQTTAMAVMQATRRGWRDMFRSGHPRLQALRAALLLGNATCVFIGLQHLPLAEFTALAMLAPMASTLLASLVLRERVTPARWAMVVLGFIGMLMIVRPGNGDLGWAASFPLAGALFFAAFQIVTNRLSAVDDMVTTNFFSGLGALLLLCVALALMPLDVMPSLSHASASQWLLIGMVGALATLGQMCMVLAIRSAPLSTLTPFSYAQIAFAALISWLLFRHAPDVWAAAGMALIGVGGAATVWLNARGAPGHEAQLSRGTH
jgi:drug/metabolite transporter (DMT)-like permease